MAAIWGNIEEAKDYVGNLPADGYICQILRVKHDAKDHYLEIEYDIADGEYKDFFSDAAASLGWWPGSFRKYYEGRTPEKDKYVKQFFKSFLMAIERSNDKFVANKFDLDKESHVKALEGKMIGLTIGIKKVWGKNDGKEHINNYVDMCRSIEEIREGNFKIPKDTEDTRYKPKYASEPVNELNDADFIALQDDDDVPF